MSSMTTTDVAESAQHRVLCKYVDLSMNERLSNLLKTIVRSPKAKEFLKPVTGIPAYRDVIFQPMDFGTVQKTLEMDLRVPWAEKEYLTAEDFGHDVRLVFKNCFLFNHDVNHHLFKDAKFLCLRFEENFAELLRKAESSGPRCPLEARCAMLLSDLQRHPLTEWFRREEDWQDYGQQYLLQITRWTWHA